MSMTYTTFVQRLAVKLDLMGTDFTFSVPLPEIIDYAESRIYRDLNLIATVVASGATATVASTREFNLPTPSSLTFQAVSGINLITPASTLPAAGTRNPLVKMSLAALNYISPSATTGQPTMYAMVTDQQIALGPTPDNTYNVEVIGSVRPAALSASNTTTWLATNLPDLFLQAAMMNAAQYLPAKKAEAPAMQAEYGVLLASANAEEIRRRYNLAVNTPVGATAATAQQAPTGPMGASIT